MIVKKIFKPAEHLVTESIPPTKMDLSSSAEPGYLSLQEIFSNQTKNADKKVYKLQIKSEDDLQASKSTLVELSFQRLTFEHSDCLMLTIRDISHLERLEKQSISLQILELTTSSVRHDMITPLKAVS